MPAEADPIEQPVQLPTRACENLVFSSLGPGKPVPLQPLLPRSEAVALPQKQLQSVISAVSEGEGRRREGIEAELLGHYRRQPALAAQVDASAFTRPHWDTIPTSSRRPPPRRIAPFELGPVRELDAH